MIFTSRFGGMAVVDGAGWPFEGVLRIDTETGWLELKEPVIGSAGQKRLFIPTPVSVFPNRGRLHPPYRNANPIEWKPEKPCSHTS